MQKTVIFCLWLFSIFVLSGCNQMTGAKSDCTVFSVEVLIRKIIRSLYMQRNRITKD